MTDWSVVEVLLERKRLLDRRQLYDPLFGLELNQLAINYRNQLSLSSNKLQLFHLKEQMLRIPIQSQQKHQPFDWKTISDKQLIIKSLIFDN